jgi:chromosome segregation ATPase
MSYRPGFYCTFLASAITAAALSGCNRGVTTEDVGDKQEEVAELAKDIQQLESEKEERVAEAAKDERESIEEELQEKRQALTEEQKQLAALKVRQGFEDDMQAKLDSVQKRIDELEKQAGDAQGEQEVQLRQQAEALRTRHRQMQEQLDALRSTSSDEDWTTNKAALEEAWTSAEQSMRGPAEPAPSAEPTAPKSEPINDPS